MIDKYVILSMLYLKHTTLYCLELTGPPGIYFKVEH